MTEILSGLDTKPRQAYTFLWADYVELLTLCGEDGRFSRGNLEELQQEGEELQVDDDGINFTSTEQDDDVAKRWDEIKAKLLQRRTAYATWPFELNGNVLRRVFDANLPGHRLYAALLIASSLRLCPKKRIEEISAALEEVAYLLFMGMLPEGWKVIPFGAHQTIADGYTGTLRGRLEQLADDIHGRLMKQADDYDSSDTGDGGIDVVAWDNLGDARGHMPVIFAQCGCSPTDWEHKQLSVTPAAIESHIAAQHPGAAYYVTPHDLSASNEKWERASHVARVVVLDRRRLMHLADLHSVLNKLPAWPFVDEAIKLGYRLSS